MSDQPNPQASLSSSKTPSFAELCAQVEASKARIQARRAKVTRPPRGKGPTQATRPDAALPPPHIRVPRDIDADALREKRARSALSRGFRDVASLPWWSWVVASRCHAGDWRAEVRRLPRGLSLRVQRAAELGRSEHAQRSIAALGCVLAWISLRNPRSVRRGGGPQNVGGLSGAQLRQLTDHAGAPYSLSSVQHATHVGQKSERPMRSPEDGTAGFLEHLRQSGVLVSWVPNAKKVPAFMRGEAYAFAVFRLAPEALRPWHPPPPLQAG